MADCNQGAVALADVMADWTTRDDGDRLVVRARLARRRHRRCGRSHLRRGRPHHLDTGRRRSGAASNRLYGLVIPGMGNAHSHAFHRALRARTQRDRGSFWTWRDLMYRAADRLDPDRYRQLARGVYAEMALAGITSVGEFHYLHHDAGRPAVLRPECDGARADRGRRRRRSSPDPARHVLSELGARRDTAEGRATTALRRRQRSGLGRACRGTASSGTHQRGRDRRCRIAFGARGAGRAHARRGGMGRRPTRPRCMCTRRSSGPKSSSASPHTGVRPRPSSTTRGCSDRGPPPCTPRI